MRINIIGAYHSPFGKLQEHDLYSLYSKAVEGALHDASVEAKDIDGIFVANYSGGGFNNQENIAPYAVNINSDFRHKPIFRVETACASGSSAVHLALMSIMSGMMDRVLVVGLEKMTSVSNARASEVLSYATYWPEEGARNVTAPCMFSELAKGWMKKYHISEDEFREITASISAKAYSNASSNPLAHIQKPRSKEDLLSLPEDKNPIIDHPLRLHDCSLISDGSAAVVLESNRNRSSNSGVHISGFHNAGDYLDLFGKNKSDSFLEGAAFATKKALEMANLEINNIDVAEVHDCFTITELLMYSAMGLTRPGEEFEALKKGTVYPGGTCPVNLSGGLKAKGHPIGATGVSMHAYLYKLLMQKSYIEAVKDASNALILNIGGSGTSNAATILTRE